MARSSQGKRVLAVASSGGHWQQLLEMRPGYASESVTYVTTMKGLAEAHGISGARVVKDCNRSEPLSIVKTTAQLAAIVLATRPHVVISTGALPGVIALALGKLLRARTIWVDSVANAEELSMSGRYARRVADLWLSQWEHVAEAEGADYAGSIL